MFQLLHKWGNK